MYSDINIEKIITKSNDVTVKVNGFFLHSKYDPKKEAIQFVETNYKENCLHILFGYGMGYIADELITKLSDSEELIIIDPLFDLLNEGINLKINLIKDIGDDLFKAILNSKIEKFNRRVHLIQSPNYEKITHNLYKETLVIINEQLRLNQINENTVRYFAEDWQRNYLFNLFNAVTDKSLLEIKEKYNTPVVIASGGPSLTKQLKLLNEIKEKVIIIAAGSTINTLLSYNINPDFVVSIDGSISNYNHFKNLNLKDTKYIYSLTSHYGIRESFQDAAYIFNISGKIEMNNHFEKLTKFEIPIIVGGGSVANYAFTIANYISKGPISIIGQDLAYTDNKTHAENNKNFEIIDEAYKKKKGIFFAEGYYKDQVMTDYVFLSMKESFENLHKLVEKGRDIYNCTEGGINLKGFNNLPFKDFCSKYVDDLNEKPQLESCIIDQNIEEKRISLKEQMIKELNFYNKINKILEDNLKLLNENKSKTSFSRKILNKLNKNDDSLKKLLDNVAMKSIVDPITISIQNNFLPVSNEKPIDSFNRVLNQNRALYSQMIRAVDMTKGFTQDLIEKLLKEDGAKIYE